MKQKTFSAYVAPSLAAFSILVSISVGSVYAQSQTPDTTAQRLQQKFEYQSKLLVLPVEEIKNAWSEGKNVMTLAKEKGITKEQIQQRMRDAQIQAKKDRINTLISKGIISQVQADKRNAFEQNKKQKKPTPKFHRNHRPFFF